MTEDIIDATELASKIGKAIADILDEKDGKKNYLALLGLAIFYGKMGGMKQESQKQTFDYMSNSIYTQLDKKDQE